LPTRVSRTFAIAAVAALSLVPLTGDRYVLSLMIQAGFLGIAALGLNILVGFTGQITIGHAAFFGVGAFSSAWAVEHGIPVALAIPLAGAMTTGVGLVFGLPAARRKGLYLAIATLAAQFIIEDFFARARWFSGGVARRVTAALTLAGLRFDSNETYFYVVLFYVVVMFL
jgi:branched-chain amino acid transport system permease protein